jgi:hypothetical protein
LSVRVDQAATRKPSSWQAGCGQRRVASESWVERFKTLLLLIECGVDGFFFSPSVTQLSVPALLPSIAADSVVLYINEGATTNTR